MKSFNYYAPTQVVFGADAEEQIPQLIKCYGGTKVLIHYGGGSAERSGLLPSIKQRLTDAGIPYLTLGGVVPNPRLSKAKEGIELCRKEGIDFILAVGGGSVIDSSKCMALGVPYEGDVWDFYAGKAEAKACLPLAAVLTIPAAGSEMSGGSVITKDEGDLKWSYDNNLCRCKFAIMNPERTYSLPPYQTACGVTDIMMHTMERYFSKYTDMTLTDALAEALMRTVIHSTFAVLENPTDYRNRAQIMWASSLSHNDLMECGTEKDFASHRLEHELSGMFGVTHGAGLAAIWPSWARYVMPKHVERFVQFAVNVMNVPNDFGHPQETAAQGIRAVERFYQAIGMPINLHELLGRDITDDEIEALVDKCSRQKTITVGAMEVLDWKDMKAIYEMAR